MPAPRIHILNPDPNAVIPSRTVAVVLKADGVDIAPAIDKRPGTAHFDLFLDHDVTPSDSVVPLNAGGIVHLSRGQSWHTFYALSPGPHRLIAILVSSDHVPLAPLVADTVKFTVKPKR